jgi:D-methionine transport system substrate-binding protein
MQNKPIFTLVGLMAASFGCSADQLTIGASAIPHAEIMEFIKPELAQEGVDLQIKVFTDYAQPNVEVAEKHLGCQFF